MSLSRILNNEPPSASSAQRTTPGPTPIDPVQVEPSSSSGPPTRPHSHTHHHPSHLNIPPPPPRGYAYRPVAYQGAGGWDPYSGDWVQGDIFPLGLGGNNHYAQHEFQRRHPVHREDPELPPRDYHEDGEGEDTVPRKRRKGVGDDFEHQAGSHKRVSWLSNFSFGRLLSYHSHLAKWTPQTPSSNEAI